jgi:hypothetical protein
VTETLRFLVSALTAGAVAVWASENLFWSLPQPDWTLAGMALTWIAYSLAAACALAALAYSGARGWRGHFLTGCLLGFMVEGVIVDTMYDAFPVQLVWTPLAWHALLTTFALGGVALKSATWPAGMTATAYSAIGLLAGYFGLYWPIDRGPLGDVPLSEMGGYLLGLGIAVPAGLAVLIPGFRLFPGGVASNVPFALTSGLLGLGLWLACLLSAARKARP